MNGGRRHLMNPVDICNPFRGRAWNGVLNGSLRILFEVQWEILNPVYNVKDEGLYLMDYSK